MKTIWVLFLFMFAYSTAFSQEKKLNIIVFGAHPDDCDETAGGSAILWAKMGHHVEFVSLTNGDKGHQTMGGGQLARIRYAEAQEAAKRFGIEKYVVLDNHDGELMPTLENRLKVIRLIREWHADVVICPRPNDYHPDHRYTGVLVQDASYMVIVPNVAPDVPALYNNPVFLYVQDRFQRPNPFTPDISVDISQVYQQKIYALAAHESQMFEWLPWTEHKLDQVPKDEKDRLIWLAKDREHPINPEVRKSLIKWYGPDKGNKVTEAESFEVCEYGKQPTEGELGALFPMISK